MKRALVQYSSDSDEPPVKKRKPLPKLPEIIPLDKPIDDPSKHQGRIRSHPHVEGQFATHVYINISNPTLLTLASKVIEFIKTKYAELSIQELLSRPGNSEKELHLSLSRPLYFRAHQREEVKRTIKEVTRHTPKFIASFASFTVLKNDEGTRSFLAIEIGAGHSQFSELCVSFIPKLEELRQATYYQKPRFHASIAWILTVDATTTSFSDELCDELNKIYGEELREASLDVTEISIKIGKSVYSWRLADSM